MKKRDPLVLQTFMEADIVSLLMKPLIQDSIATVRISALDGLATIAELTDEADDQFTDPKELAKMKTSLVCHNSKVQRSGCLALSAIACKTPSHATAVLNADVLPALQKQLAAVDPNTKEATVKLINTLVAADMSTCSEIMTPQTIQDMVFNLHLPETSDALKSAITHNLADTASLSASMAQRVVDTKGLAPITALLHSPQASTRLKTACLLALGQVAKHSDALAETVMQQDVERPAMECLLDPGSPAVRLNAALLIHEVARKTPELCTKILADGGVACLGKHLRTEAGGRNALPTVLTLGAAADFRLTVSLQAVKTGAAQELVRYLASDVEKDVQVAAAWAVSRLASYSADTARPLAAAGVLPPLLAMYTDNRATLVKERAKQGLKEVVYNCQDLSALEPLVDASTPAEVLRHVLTVFAEALPASVQCKRNFVTSGALMRMLQLQKNLPPDETLDSRAKESIVTISLQFPEDVVSYYRGSAAPITGTGTGFDDSL